MDIHVDRELCIGSGYCVRFAPGVFELDGEEIAIVIEDEAAGRDAEIEQAADSCPAGAIFLEPVDQLG